MALLYGHSCGSAAIESEFHVQKHVLEIYDRRVQVPDCPLFMVYQEGSRELDARLKGGAAAVRKRVASIKGMEHVKRTLERAVAQQSLRLESGLILLAIAVSGAPFLGVQPNGRSIDIRGCDVIEVDENDKVVTNTVYYDGAEYARQIGMLPARDSAADRAMLAAFNGATKLRKRLRAG